MSYCQTCKILRPPRSFHCGTCGVCIEVHDHHCPWVGNCIGLRNARLFIAFLFLTSLHALITALVCLLAFLITGNEIDDDFEGLVTKAICVYGAVIFLSLLIFAGFQLFFLGIRNIASNEDIRYRWNGARANAQAVGIYSEKSSCFAKCLYFLYVGQQHQSGRSRLQKFCEAVEIYEEIQEKKAALDNP